MKRLRLGQKVWLSIGAAIFVTLAFSFLLLNYFYRTVYVKEVERMLIAEGTSLAHDYRGGTVTEAYRRQIEWYDEKSTATILLIDNPRELSACWPFPVHYDALVSGRDRETLLHGKPVIKTGYEKRFDRRVMAVVVPLLDEKRLEGAIYLYMPLADVQEATKRAAAAFWPFAALFAAALLFVGKRMVRQMTEPLQAMEKAAGRMAKGDYGAAISVRTDDEIGRLAQAFNQMADAIAKEDERKREFLANVSHELRTPLSYIKGYSEALLSGLARTKEEEQSHLRLIHRETERMERLVRDLLDLAQLEGQSVPLERAPVAFAQVIEDVMDMYRPIITKKRLTLTCDLDYELIVDGDADRLEQVVRNLLDNAIRYTPEGGAVTVRLSRFSDTEGELVIRDTGKGIPKDQLPLLGQRFFRVDRARTRKEGGTGLGLAIVKQIVALHGGAIQFDSDLGQGTTVSVRLPLVQEEE
ncbi:sensor histidine kinase [Geobacillus thermodenitrificans]|jgi:signal transduction histidine kinase|uniref:sensor histidine kinase n=1 Tax=Geobacillus thermodenitrificans TaxID=33940 RepID=UPI0004A45197|nr:HAMP domain-containing sensor histidine kinase [Geobacillus thermodenitrificans]ARA99210.1 two-component sensor histidine kinase [Geobacillus thermodenitrificans]